MPSLLPPSALGSFILRISCDTRFTPLFSLVNATILYSLLNSFITPHGLSILVPLAPVTSFVAFRIHTFPLPLNGSFYTLSPDHDVVLRSLDHTSLSFISSDVISSCSSVLSRYRACFDVFPPEHSYFSFSCNKVLLSDGDVQSSCMFNQFNITNPFLLTLPDLHLLYFLSIAHVSISCGGDHTDREVVGALILPRSCRISSRLISLRSSLSFHFTYKPATTLSPISIDLSVTNVSLPISNVRLLPSYTMDTADLLPFSSSPHVTFGFPVLSTAIGLAVTFCCFMLYRRRTIRRLRLLPVAVPARDDPACQPLPSSIAPSNIS